MSEFCNQLHQLFRVRPIFGFPFDKNKIPLNGIYVLFEKGESAHGTKRIVRVGSHTGLNQLRSRLEQHYINENKDRSIFRKNIGRAILNRSSDPFLSQWELDLTSREAKDKHRDSIDFKKQNEAEKRVTEYIQSNFTFVVFRVDDKEARLAWESRIISTVSLCEECGPSDKWLGLHSPKQRIRESGLWIVNELYKQPLSEQGFETLRNVVTSSGVFEKPMKPTLADAILLAVRAHSNQVDKCGQPYILHPLRVMLSLETETERIVGVLHDVVEDTNVTVEELKDKGYSPEILTALDCVTNREGESYEDFVLRAKSNPTARRVRLADLADNMDIRRLPNPTQKDQERLARYRKALAVLADEKTQVGEQ